MAKWQKERKLICLQYYSSEMMLCIISAFCGYFRMWFLLSCVLRCVCVRVWHTTLVQAHHLATAIGRKCILGSDCRPESTKTAKKYGIPLEHATPRPIFYFRHLLQLYLYSSVASLHCQILNVPTHSAGEKWICCETTSRVPCGDLGSIFTVSFSKNDDNYVPWHVSPEKDLGTIL